MANSEVSSLRKFEWMAFLVFIASCGTFLYGLWYLFTFRNYYSDGDAMWPLLIALLGVLPFLTAIASYIWLKIVGDKLASKGAVFLLRTIIIWSVPLSFLGAFIYRLFEPAFDHNVSVFIALYFGISMMAVYLGHLDYLNNKIYALSYPVWIMQRVTFGLPGISSMRIRRIWFLLFVMTVLFVCLYLSDMQGFMQDRVYLPYLFIVFWAVNLFWKAKRQGE